MVFFSRRLQFPSALCTILFLLVFLVAAPESHSEECANTGIISGKITHRTTRSRFFDTLVYISKVDNEPYTDEGRSVVLDQQEGVFTPRLLIGAPGLTVKFQNHDVDHHSVYCTEPTVYKFKAFAPGESRSFTFLQPGFYTQLCDIHSHMRAYVAIMQNRHFTIAKKDGSFIINDVPAGRLELKVWNERLKDRYKDISISVNVEPCKESHVDWPGSETALKSADISK